MVRRNSSLGLLVVPPVPLMLSDGPALVMSLALMALYSVLFVFLMALFSCGLALVMNLALMALFSVLFVFLMALFSVLFLQLFGLLGLVNQFHNAGPQLRIVDNDLKLLIVQTGQNLLQMRIIQMGQIWTFSHRFRPLLRLRRDCDIDQFARQQLPQDHTPRQGVPLRTSSR